MLIKKGELGLSKRKLPYMNNVNSAHITIEETRQADSEEILQKKDYEEYLLAEAELKAQLVEQSKKEFEIFKEKYDKEQRENIEVRLNKIETEHKKLVELLSATIEEVRQQREISIRNLEKSILDISITCLYRICEHNEVIEILIKNAINDCLERLIEKDSGTIRFSESDRSLVSKIEPDIPDYIQVVFSQTLDSGACEASYNFTKEDFSPRLSIEKMHTALFEVYKTRHHDD